MHAQSRLCSLKLPKIYRHNPHNGTYEPPLRVQLGSEFHYEHKTGSLELVCKQWLQSQSMQSEANHLTNN